MSVNLWLSQVAYRLCDYIAKGNKEMLVSNRLRSIADVVLERVAEILGKFLILELSMSTIFFSANTIIEKNYYLLRYYYCGSTDRPVWVYR